MEPCCEERMSSILEIALARLFKLGVSGVSGLSLASCTSSRCKASVVTWLVAAVAVPISLTFEKIDSTYVAALISRDLKEEVSPEFEIRPEFK
jgi:hypothetical protein